MPRNDSERFGRIEFGPVEVRAVVGPSDKRPGRDFGLLTVRLDGVEVLYIASTLVPGCSLSGLCQLVTEGGPGSELTFLSILGHMLPANHELIPHVRRACQSLRWKAVA